MRVERAAAIGVLLASLSSLPACADILGIDDPVPEGTDAAIEPGPVVYEGGVPIDPFDAGEAGACAEGDLDPQGTFVSIKGGSSDPSCGSQTDPCNSVGIGVLHAMVDSDDNGGTVYIARGLYVETVVLPSNITIQGGFDEAFDWTCNPEDVQIRAPPGSYTTFVANAAQGITLDTLTVSSMASEDVPPFHGDSLIGILATSSSSLSLNNVVVVTGNAGSGANGPSGGSGMPGGTDCSSGAGQMGGPGGPGNPGEEGSYSMIGYTPGVGGVGGMGSSGGNSTSGACGGGGGQGGLGGQGGGSSIAVYAYDSSVYAVGGLFQSGSGGNGGTGGGGGPGGMGGSGAGAAGSGGVGGGGAGGDSFAILQAAGAHVSFGTTTLFFGQAGQGGSGGNAGVAGKHGVEGF